MERRSSAVLSGFGAFAVLGVFLAGVPACLLRLVGNPLPAKLPAWSSVVAAVESGALPPGVLVRVVAVVVWIWWSQVALSTVTEVAAILRGRTARPLPLRALGMQPIVTRLVAILVAGAGTLGLLAQPVLGATPSFAGIAVGATAGEATHGVAGESPARPPAVAEAGASPARVAAPTAAAVTPAPQAPILAPPGGSAMPPAPPQPVAAAEPSVPVLSPPETRSAPPAPPGTPPAPPAPPGTPPAPPAPPGRGPSLAPPDVTEPAPRAREGSSPPLPSPAAEPVFRALRANPEAIGAAPCPDSASEPEPRSGEATTQSATSGWVIVKPGDSLWLLAETHLGDALRWEDIYELNSGPLPGGGTLRDPNVIHPGWRLRLPVPDPSGSADAAERIRDAEPTPAGSPSPGPG